MTDNNSTDLLEIDTTVQPLDWGSTSTQVDSENNNTLEKSNNTNSENDLLSVEPDVPALDWTTYNPEALKYLDQEPTEDKWYDNFGVPVLSGMYGQARNELNAVMNPVDQLLDALTGGKVDIDSISTGGDKYQGFWPQTQYAIGEAITQFGTSLLAGGLGGAKGLGEGATAGGAVGGTPGAVAGGAIGGLSGATLGYLIGGATAAAGQGLAKYKSSYLEAVQRGLSEEAARKEATLKTWDSIPVSVLEQAIPFGVGKIPVIDKLIAKGAAKLLPNGAAKILDKPLAKAIMSGGAHEYVQEYTEGLADIGVEHYVGEREPYTLREVVTKPLADAAAGAIVGGAMGGGGYGIRKLLQSKDQKTINRTKEGYDKFIDNAVQKAIDKQAKPEVNTQQEQQVQPKATTQQEQQAQPEATTQQEQQAQPEVNTQQEQQVQPEVNTQKEQQLQPEINAQKEQQLQPEINAQQEQLINKEQYYTENIKSKEIRTIDNDDGTKTYYKRSKTTTPVRPIKSIEELAYDDNGNQYVKGKVKLEDALNNKHLGTNYKITYADKDKYKPTTYKDGFYLVHKYKLSSEKEFNKYNSKQQAQPEQTKQPLNILGKDKFATITNDDGTTTYYKGTHEFSRPIKFIEELDADNNIIGKVKLENVLTKRTSGTNYNIVYTDDSHALTNDIELQSRYKLSSEKEFNKYNSKSTVPSVLKTGAKTKSKAINNESTPDVIGQSQIDTTPKTNTITNDDGTTTQYIIKNKDSKPIKYIEKIHNNKLSRFVLGKAKLEDILNNKITGRFNVYYEGDGEYNFNKDVTVEEIKQNYSLPTTTENTKRDYTPVSEKETSKKLDELEAKQKEWFATNEITDELGNRVYYNNIDDKGIYTYTTEKGRKQKFLGVNLLNKATGELDATKQSKDINIIENESGEDVQLNKIPLGSKKNYTVSVNGYVVNDKASARDVHHISGLYKRMQISSRKNPNGTTTTIITTPANTKIKGAEANLTQTITDGTSTTTITENPVTVSNTKPDTIEREEAVQKQKSQTRKKAIKKQKTGLTDAAIVNQSLVSGSANQSTFAQIMETNSDQFTKTGKPDTIPTEADEAKRVMDIDLFEQDYAIQQQANSVGISSNNLTTLDEVNKLGNKVPPQLVKNKIRYLVNKLAGIADTVILDKLQQKGIAGKHPTENTLGMTSTKLGYGRVRKAMDYLSALHELAHNIWQSGSDLDSEGTKIHPDIIGIKSLANSKGLKLRELYKELNKAWNIINSKVDLPSYTSRKVPEEQFCEIFSRYMTDHDMANKIKQTAPTLASLMDEQIDSMPEAREVVSQLRDLTTAYNNLSSKGKLLANMELVPKEPTKLQEARNWFTQDGKDWWFSRLWTRFIDTTHFTRRASKHLAKKNPTEKDKLEYLSDAVEYIQTTESYDAKEFLSGRGITADGTYLGRQFKSVAEMTSNIVDVAIANLPADKRTDAKAIKEKVKEMNNNFLAYLYALDTVGSYTGNKKVMENVRKLVQDTNMSLVSTHKILSMISDNFWGVFTKEGSVTKSDFTPEQLKLLNNDSKLIDKTVVVINSIKSKITVPSESELVKIASNSRPYEHTIKDDGTVDLDAARATWLYENYKLPNAKDVAETGADLIDALNVVVETESDPLAHVYKQLAEDYYTYQDSLLEYVKNYSIGGGAWVDSVRENGHAYYVPLLRMFENNEEQTDYPEVNDRMYKMFHREGSTRPIRNIWESTIKQTNSLVYGAHQSRVKEAFVEMANAVGGGKFIRERSEASLQVSLKTSSLISQIKEELETKRQELSDRGMNVSGLTDESIDALAESLAKANITSFNLFVPDTQFKKLQDARIFTVWDPKTNKLRYYEVDKSIWLSFNKQVIDPNSWFGKLGTVLHVFTNIIRLGLIEYNPAFNLVVNPLRDASTTTLKGDVKLIYLPNHPVAEQFIPLNRTLGMLKGLVTNYYQYIFQPKKMQEKYDLLDQLGLGFNMRRATYEDISAKENAGRILYDNPIRRLFSFRMWLGEESRTTDKWGRIMELEAYMKQHKITPENMEISASRAASLTLTKGTLVNLGINESVLRGILTPEQINIFRKTKSNEYMCIDPTKDQQDKLDDLVKNDKTIATNIKNQEMSLLDRAKLNRALALATTDFSRGGELTKNLNHIILFSQAATNGIVQYGEVVKRKWNNGQRADVIGMFISDLIMGYLASAFDFIDDEQPYDDMTRGLRWKFSDKLTWTQPVQFPDQIMFMVGTHLYRSLNKVNPETSMDLIKAWASSLNPYQSLGSFGVILDAFSNKQLSKFSTKPIPGMSVYDEIKRIPPEERINKSTGRLAMLIAKHTGIPAVKVQYLMNNSGARFWDRIIESAIGFDSGTYMTTGQWTSTSGGFFENIMQNTLGVNKFLYETSYEKGINRLVEEAIKKITKSANTMSEEDFNNARYAKISQDIIKEYTKMYYIARDPEVQAEIRREKAKVARDLFEMLLSKDIISEDLLRGYLESKSQENKSMKAMYKELDKSGNYVPIKSGIDKIKSDVQNIMDLGASDAKDYNK